MRLLQLRITRPLFKNAPTGDPRLAAGYGWGRPPPLPPLASQAPPSWRQPIPAATVCPRAPGSQYTGAAAVGTQMPVVLPGANTQTWLITHLLAQMQQQDGGTTGLGTAGKACRKLHTQKNQVYSEPESVIDGYLFDVRRRLGVEEDDTWQLWMMTQQLQFGKTLGMNRLHHRVSHDLSLSLRGRRSRARPTFANFSELFIRP